MYSLFSSWSTEEFRFISPFLNYAYKTQGSGEQPGKFACLPCPPPGKFGLGMS
jgi:hypothetical protein